MDQGEKLFIERTAVLATMHGKEQVIAPILKEMLGIQVTVPPAFDTDRFGTFTGEIPRTGAQIEAARAKALRALELGDESLVIASEGSFGPHPGSPFIACDLEVILLLDTRHGIEIVGTSLSIETNFSHKIVCNLSEAQEFAVRVGFPQHGLIVSAQLLGDSQNRIFKGITNEAFLNEAIKAALSESPTAFIQTDMRAMHNPTRMKVIAEATRDLVAKVHSYCPQCGWPGFEITQRRVGLPCEWCMTPTELALAVVYICKKCSYCMEKKYPDGEEFADPGRCQFCNP